MQLGMHKTTINAIFDIKRKNGFKGFYNGYWTTVLREIPFDAIQFITFEIMKNKMTNKNTNTVIFLPIGAISGVIAGFITNPIDVVKTRIMTQPFSSKDKNYISTPTKMAKLVYKNEGYRAFLGGAGVRVVWIGLGGGVFFYVNETCRRLFD
ncbi:hypothetical protein MHBO_004787 [Bonamia ostreae]|uniref:Mitochondrial carrier protein n=1 Tax=Bonamia ostreae TaxID=126728 RepID=A0ABV2AV19_9EUKA